MTEREAYGKIIESLADCENSARLLALLTERHEWVLMSSQFHRLQEGVRMLAANGAFTALRR